MLREHERAHASSDERVVLVHGRTACIFGHDDRSKKADNRVQLTRHLPTERNDGFIHRNDKRQGNHKDQP